MSVVKRSAALIAAGMVGFVAAVVPVEQRAVAAAVAPSSVPTSAAPGLAAGDLALNGWGDGSGYHLDVLSGGSGNDWRQVALIRPDGIDDSSWTGYQCLSGDGRYAAVAVLPASAVNTPSLRAHGAFAYTVELADGVVHAVASGVALEYF